eukprot:m51a1_g3894 hypothetical protein (151) ;mRNA; f:82548-83287
MGVVSKTACIFLSLFTGGLLVGTIVSAILARIFANKSGDTNEHVYRFFRILTVVTAAVATVLAVVIWLIVFRMKSNIEGSTKWVVCLILVFFAFLFALWTTIAGYWVYWGIFVPLGAIVLIIVNNILIANSSGGEEPTSDGKPETKNYYP